MIEQCGDDTHLLLVSSREITDVFLLVENLAAHQQGEVLQALADFLRRHVVHLTDKLEILLWCQEVNQESFIDIGTRTVFPMLIFGGVHLLLLLRLGVCDLQRHLSFVSLQQVQQQSEEGSLTGSVVTYQSHHFALADSQ